VDPRVARRAVIRWTSLIVGLLVLQVGLCGLGVFFALRGKAVVVEADYYNKALNWDQKQAQLRAARELAWGVDLSVGQSSTTQGQRALMLNLADAQGAAITDATVDVAYFHHARPRDVRQADLKSAGQGLYASSLPLDRRGLWEFRLTIHRGDQVFVETLQKDLLP
jgi:hypothetical protein